MANIQLSPVLTVRPGDWAGTGWAARRKAAVIAARNMRPLFVIPAPAGTQILGSRGGAEGAEKENCVRTSASPRLRAIHLFPFLFEDGEEDGVADVAGPGDAVGAHHAFAN